MNIITIMSDEHSFHTMGWAGNPLVKTPNLDRLAAMSARFHNAYTTCPLCVPARASWFTGQYVNRLGTWDNSTPYDGSVMGISKYLHQQNVDTYHFGKTHFHPQGEYEFEELQMPGFLNRPDLGCYYRDQKIGRVNAEKRFKEIGIRDEADHDDKVTELAVNWLKKNYKKTEKWNLQIGYLAPHFPFYVKQENWDYFDPLIKDIPDGTKKPYTSLNEPLRYLRAYFKGEVADTDTIRKIMVGYYASIKELDDRIGILLDTLEELDLMKSTAIIYTSDHGEQMGYHGLWWKCCMFEQSSHIPLLLYHPELEPRDLEQPVTLVDLFPTVCDILEIKQPDNIDGESLWGLMKYGIDPKKREFAFSEYHAHGMPCAMYMIRWGAYKYIYYTNYEPQLFQLERDPEEDCDLWNKVKENKELQEVVHRCHEYLLSVCDPIRTDQRAQAFQKNIKQKMGLENGNIKERGEWVPRPEYYGKR